MKERGWALPAVLAAILLTAVLVAQRFDFSATAAAQLVHSWGAGPAESAALVPRQPAVAPGDPDGYQPPTPSPGVSVDARALWGRQFLLEGPELERGVTLGDTQRLRRQVAHLMAGEKVRLAAVGASVTAGAGALGYGRTRTNWPGYAQQFQDWLRAAFPKSNASMVNAGMAGTFSGVFAQCFDTLVPPADIYILEQTTFDGTEPHTCHCRRHYVDTPVQLGIERLIRRMLKQPWQPAVVLVNQYGFRFPNNGVFQNSVENQVQVMAQFYGLPMASFRAATWRRMLEGGHGFDVSVGVKDFGEGPLPPKFPLYFDSVHPWGPTGHRVLAELLIHVVQSTAASLSLQPLTAQERNPPAVDLFPPMKPGNYEGNSSSCWLGDHFYHLVNSTDGFDWISERPEVQERKNQKWGFVATQPGSRLDFVISTRVSAADSQPNRVLLSYLASYDERMGVARLECLKGCECDALEVDALWEEKASVLMTAELQATPHPKCHMRVTVLSSTGRKHKEGKKRRASGTKFKVTGVMVLPAGTNEFSATDSLASERLNAANT